MNLLNTELAQHGVANSVLSISSRNNSVLSNNLLISGFKNNTVDVPILVEEACQGLCDDEEEDGREGASLGNSGSERERGAEEAVGVELSCGWCGVRVC